MTQLRNDLVVSVCVADMSESEADFENVRALARQLDAIYRFREIILVVGAAEGGAFLGLVQEVPDVRLLLASPGTSHYDRRAIAANEAIGDVVLIGSADEIGHLDVVSLLQQVETSDSIVLVRRSTRRPVRTVLFWPLHTLGRMAGFNVNDAYLQTNAMTRSLLNHLLAHPEPQLALRFPPRDPRLPVVTDALSSDTPSPVNSWHLRRRMQVMLKLLVYLAPKLLIVVSISSVILVLLGLGFGVYVLGAWIMLESLAEGWLTTSAMLSLSATFVGLSMLGISLGLQQVLAQNTRSTRDPIAKEVNRIDLFGKVGSELNVELSGEASRAQRRGS